MRGDIIPPRRREDDSNVSVPPQTPASESIKPVAAPVSQDSIQPQNAPAQTVSQDAINEVSLDQTSQAPGLPVKKQKTSFKKKILVGLTTLVVLIGLIAVAVWIWYGQQLAAVEPGSDEKVKVTIEQGTDPAGIAAVLKQNDVIRSESAFQLYVRIQGASGTLQSGAYRLGKGEDVPSIVKHLTSGNTDTFSVTFLPGATLQKHRQVLIDAGYDATEVDVALAKRYDHPLLQGRPTNADLEGYIYGETYSFSAETTPEQILTHTFDQYWSVVKAENLVNSYKSRGFTLFQGITLASIIQREVATPQDAAQVAQVFELRLKQGMQLGSDVTYQYIADKTGQERSVDLDSPYNTRRYTGLPPGPIASPGLSALKSVGNPAPGDFVYFLSGDDDKTYFARTNEEHEKNIIDHCEKKCQII